MQKCTSVVSEWDVRSFSSAFLLYHCSLAGGLSTLPPTMVISKWFRSFTSNATASLMNLLRYVIVESVLTPVPLQLVFLPCILLHCMQYNWTPLFLAAWGGHMDVVKYLLKNANCNVKIRDVVSVALYAELTVWRLYVHYWYPISVGLLLTNYKDGRDLLGACCWSGNLELVKWFTEEYEAKPILTKVLYSWHQVEGNSIVLNPCPFLSLFVQSFHCIVVVMESSRIASVGVCGW